MIIGRIYHLNFGSLLIFHHGGFYFVFRWTPYAFWWTSLYLTYNLKRCWSMLYFSLLKIKQQSIVLYIINL